MTTPSRLSAHPSTRSDIPDLAERSFFSTMEAFAAGTLATDRHGLIVWINEKYCQLLGVDLHDLIGRPILSALPHSRIPEVLASGRPIVLDVMEHQGHKYVVSRFPVLDEDKNVIGAFGFVLHDGIHEISLLHDLGSRPAPLPAPDRRAVLHGPTFEGTSHQACKVRMLAEKAARVRASVLVTGPTGCGKEVVARSVHLQSDRAARNLVAINVGAIPESLFEAEFFGSAPGAFTGADRRGRVGKLQLADGGTLFLDEVGDMPAGAQVKLLRFLETGEFEQLGSNKLIHVDVRIVAATSVDLRKAVAERRFRADLYYRLAVLLIPVPPLTARRQDLPELSRSLLTDIASKNRIPLPVLLPCAAQKLQSLDWPGNVRELRNLLERCAIIGSGMPIDLGLVEGLLEPGLENTSSSGPSGWTLGQAIEALERDKISTALSTCQGSIGRAARALSISRTTLYKKAEKFGLLPA